MRRRLLGAVEGDGVGRAELPGVDLLGLGEEPADLGAPRLVAGLAVVGQQVVVAGNAVARRGERVGAQPPLVETVCQVTCAEVIEPFPVAARDRARSPG